MRAAAVFRWAMRTFLASLLLMAPAAAPALAQNASPDATRDSVWLIPIDTEITPATAHFVASRVDRANAERPLALLFVIDTPGGQVSAMQDIVDTILNGTQVPTLGVVRNAFSAGALIAMSVEKLAMLPGSSIGAALPIVVQPTGASPVDEKFNSAVRGEFRSVAEARGRNATVAEGMVDQRIVIPGLSTAEELVTLTATQAVDNGIADIQANTVADALSQFGYGGASIVRMEPNLTERLGTALASPIIAAALLVIGVGGLLIEIFTPGFGVAGGLGLVALILFATTAFVATPAGPLDLVLIVAGVILLAVEVLIIPGFGFAGVLGIAAIIVAVVRIFQDSAVSVLGYAALFGGALVILMLWMLPNSRIAAAFRLSTRLTNPPAPAGDVPASADKAYLAGAEGVATSDLRPAGVARFGNERVDVVSEGDFIPVGSTVRVLRVEGMRVTVRSVDPKPEPTP